MLRKKKSFEPVFDHAQTIRGFRISGLSETSGLIPPQLMSENINGGEHVTIEGQEYNLTERGNLIACGVEMPKRLTIGYGVIIRSGVRFAQSDEEVSIGSGSSIGSEDSLRIGKAVDIGKGVVLAVSGICDTDARPSTYAASEATLEGMSAVEDRVKIGNDTTIGLGVMLGAGSRIGSDVTLADGTFTEPNVTVGDRVRIGNYCHLAYFATVGTGAALGNGTYMDLRSQAISGYAVTGYIPKDAQYPAGV